MLLKAVANNRNYEKGNIKAAIGATNGSSLTGSESYDNTTSKEEGSGEESLSGDYLSESGSGSGASGDTEFQGGSSHGLLYLDIGVHGPVLNSPIGDMEKVCHSPREGGG